MATDTTEAHRELTVLIDCDSNECLYIDGQRWEYSGESTIYATELAAAAGEALVRLTHCEIDFHHLCGWPETLADALTQTENCESATKLTWAANRGNT